MIDSFISFDLSLFLKTQYPTHAHIRVPPHSIVSPAYASGNPSTRNRVLRTASLTPETFHHLGTLGLKGFTSPTLGTPTPNNCSLPVCLPSSPLSAPPCPASSLLHPSTGTQSLTYPGPPQSPRSQFRLCVPDALGSEKTKGAPPLPPPPLLELQPSRSSPSSPGAGRRPAPTAPFSASLLGRAAGWESQPRLGA